MDKISRAKTPANPLECPEQCLKNYGARQFEYAFVKRQPRVPARGKSASGFLKCVCKSSYCVGSISCVGCVAQLRKMLRTASSALQLRPPQLRTSVLRNVACQLRSCASPNSMLSRMFRNSRRAATAMKVQRTAERLAHLAEIHKRAVELSGVSPLRPGPVDQSVPALSELRSSKLRPGELRQCELNAASPSHALSTVSSSASSSSASSSVLRPCELRPVASPSESSELRPELRIKRESPLRKFASVASQSASVKSASVKSVTVALLRPPKRSLH
jgi:hypothetical protein